MGACNKLLELEHHQYSNRAGQFILSTNWGHTKYKLHWHGFNSITVWGWRIVLPVSRCYIGVTKRYGSATSHIPNRLSILVIRGSTTVEVTRKCVPVVENEPLMWQMDTYIFILFLWMVCLLLVVHPQMTRRVSAESTSQLDGIVLRTRVSVDNYYTVLLNYLMLTHFIFPNCKAYYA